jgi:hypothetical protein
MKRQSYILFGDRGLRGLRLSSARVAAFDESHQCGRIGGTFVDRHHFLGTSQRGMRRLLRCRIPVLGAVWRYHAIPAPARI